MSNENNKLTSMRKLYLLIIIVKKNKVEYYIDLMQSFNVNLQLSFKASGTTKSRVFNDEEGTKRVIFNVISGDDLKDAMNILKEKFEVIHDGKGVAFAVPFSSVMGTSFFNFLSNNRNILGSL